MRVVGITNQQEFWAASKNKKFKINELLVIEDSFQGELMGEVVETISYDDYILPNKNISLDENLKKSLEKSGYNLNSDTIYIAKIKLLIEASYPVETGANIRNPNFDEVKSFLIPKNTEKSLILGKVKSTEDIYTDANQKNKNGIPFYFDLHDMLKYPHMGVFGGSGSGKSTFIRVLLEELIQKSVPSLVFDPHYELSFEISKSGKDFASRTRVLTIGEEIGVSFIELSTNDLKNLLSSSSPLTDGMISAIEALHKTNDTFETFYERITLLSEGLDLGEYRVDLIANSSSPNATRCMQMLELMRFYGDQVTAASVKGLIWRLKRLLKDGVFNNDITPITNALKNRLVVVIRGTSRLLQVFTSYILYKLYKERRDYKDTLNTLSTSSPEEVAPYFPPFMIIMDEAHNFVPHEYDTPSKHIVTEISQEGRKYSIFLILATQRPSLLSETITAQLNSKYVFRIVRETDIETIKKETDLSPEESRRLPYLQSGDSFFSSAIMGRTIPVRIRLPYTQSPNISGILDELTAENNLVDDPLAVFLFKYLPIYETEIPELAQKIQSETNTKISSTKLLSKLEVMVAEGKIIKRKYSNGVRYEEYSD